jgi:transposase
MSGAPSSPRVRPPLPSTPPPPRRYTPAGGAGTEIIAVELFVAALGASNHTYAKATRTQQVPDWIGSHARACAFFGGLTATVVCAAITMPGRRGGQPGQARRGHQLHRQMSSAIFLPSFLSV